MVCVGRIGEREREREEALVSCELLKLWHTIIFSSPVAVCIATMSGVLGEWEVIGRWDVDDATSRNDVLF